MRSVPLLLLALVLPGSVQAQPSSPELVEDERLLKAAGVAVDGPGLLAFVRARTPGPGDRERAAALVQQLGSDRYTERQRASAGLAALGMRAGPALRAALTDPDPEVRRRARESMAALEARDEEALAGAAGRLLAVRAPTGATKVLLDYLAGVAGEPAEDEVLPVLLTLVRRAGPDAALLAALEDRIPACRGVAALAVGGFGTGCQRARVRRLLNDPDPLVRLRAAQGLVAGGTPEGVPVLIALLGTAPADVGWQAEDLLRCLAGAEAPAARPADGPGLRRWQTAWESWWKKRSGHIDLKRAGMDLAELDPMCRARRVAFQFLDALAEGDLAVVWRTTDLPFVNVGSQCFTTVEQLEKFIMEFHEPAREWRLKFKEAGAITGEEFVRRGETIPGQRDPAVSAFEPLRWRQVRVVYAQVVSATRRGPSGGVYVVVRVAGGRARVLGVGPGDPPPPSRPGNPHPGRCGQSIRVKRQTGTCGGRLPV